MADRRITQLTQVSDPDSTTAVLPIVNAGITLKVSLDDLVRSSRWGNHKINNLAFAVADPNADLDPNNTQIAVQTNNSTTPPQKISLRTIYPKVVSSSTIFLTFNNINRQLAAFLVNNSIQPFHFSTGCVQASAIATGTITQDKIDPNAKLAGAIGGGNDRVFYENDQQVSTTYTITSGRNALTAGPITINNGITVTVPDGSTWTVV